MKYWQTSLCRVFSWHQNRLSNGFWTNLGYICRQCRCGGTKSMPALQLWDSCRWRHQCFSFTTKAWNSKWVSKSYKINITLYRSAKLLIFLQCVKLFFRLISNFTIFCSRPIKLKDFAEHYRIMAADSDFRFSEEFELLKHVGRDKPCNAADLPVNRPKNRFTNILPYDHSRIKLMPTDDEEGTDYINANYIPVSAD